MNEWAKADFGKSYDNLGNEQQAMLQSRLEKELRTNTHNFDNGVLTISPVRAEAFRELSRHYGGLFMDDPSKADLRDAYSIPPNSIKTEDRMFKMNAFFFWTTWSTITQRPGSDITYTNNWPPDELVGNKPTSSLDSLDRVSASSFCWPE